MVQYRRNFVAGGTYFFTVALHDRRKDWLVAYIDLLRNAIRESKRARPFHIDAMVVLPEHLHAVMTLPADDADFDQRWRSIKSRFSRAIAAAGAPATLNKNGAYDVWQPRYWEHTIRDERDLEHHVAYIHYNPVKHGHVSKVAAWPHSSFHRYVRMGMLPEDWGGEKLEDLRHGYGE
jgi:putative transposase